MIRLFISSITISLLLTSVTQAAEIKTDSTIKAVTIYPSSAKVVRVSTVKLEAGDHDVIINNLPINLNETSLRVSGEGQGNISLGSVELLRNFQEDVVQEREKEIREKIETLQDERRETQDALLRSRKQFEYIQRMALGSNSKTLDNTNNNASGGTYKNLPLDKWQVAWETLDSATAVVQEKTRLAEKLLKTSDKRIKKLQRELQQVAVNQRETRTARLHVKSDSATDLTLKLTYQINGARWAPVYDADLNTSTGKIELKTLAQISQRTGEDWKGVNVTLSTLRPSAGTQLPSLNPWVLDFLPDLPSPAPMVQSRMYKNKGIRMESMADSMEMAAPMVAMAAKPAPMRKMVQQQSQIISTDFSAEYKVLGVISLDSGSNKRRFALTSQNYDANVHLASAPRQDPRAMILAKTKHTGETPLLAGSLSLYRNGSFIGNTYLQQKLSGEELKLSFGEDDKVKIKFLPDPDKKRKDGLLFGKKKVVERHYQLSIHSNHDKPYEISLYDVLPVAANEDIKVKLLGEAPSKKDLEDKKGVVSWERTLKPKQDMKLKYGYTVSYPEDKIIPSL
jgi:uncharacterized protein (TIGR02231 family)